MNFAAFLKPYIENKKVVDVMAYLATRRWERGSASNYRVSPMLYLLWWPTRQIKNYGLIFIPCFYQPLFHISDIGFWGEPMTDLIVMVVPHGIHKPSSANYIPFAFFYYASHGFEIKTIL